MSPLCTQLFLPNFTGYIPARPARTLDLAKRSEGGAEMDDESKEQLLSLALVCAVNLAVILLIPVLQGRL